MLIGLQKERMEKTIETVRTNFNSVRTGRANPAMLDKIEVRISLLVCYVSFVFQEYTQEIQYQKQCL